MPIADTARRRAAVILAAAFSVLALGAAPAQAGLPDRLVRLARAELNRGVHEVPNGSNNSRDIARYRTAIRWASGPAPWCGYFVSYVAREAGAPLGEYGEGIGLVSEIRRWAKLTGRWRPKPHRGNIVVFRHAHVGLVERVVGSQWIVTIEGNHDNRVARVWRRRSEARGYVRLHPVERGSDPYDDTFGDSEPIRRIAAHRSGS
jgi:CHAP domain